MEAPDVAEPPWGWRGWASVIAFTLASFLGLGAIVPATILIPAADGRPGGASITAVTIVMAGAALGLAGIGVGLALGVPRRDPPKFHGWCTATLGMLAVPGVLFVGLIGSIGAGDPGTARLNLMTQTLIGYPTALLTILAALRVLRLRVAVPLSAATSFFLIGLFPWGTVPGLLWLLLIRPQEDAVF